MTYKEVLRNSRCGNIWAKIGTIRAARRTNGVQIGSFSGNWAVCDRTVLVERDPVQEVSTPHLSGTCETCTVFLLLGTFVVVFLLSSNVIYPSSDPFCDFDLVASCGHFETKILMHVQSSGMGGVSNLGGALSLQ